MERLPHEASQDASSRMSMLTLETNPNTWYRSGIADSSIYSDLGPLKPSF
jgi:hypothetical protein